MAIDKKFVDKFIKVTIKAALSSSYLIGKKDKISKTLQFIIKL